MSIRISGMSVLGSAFTLALLFAGLGLYARDASTVEVLPEEPATAANREVGPAQNSPTIVADPADSDFLVMAHRRDAPAFGCGLQLSGDGGRGWAPTEPVPALPQGADTCYGPEVAFDREGTLHYLFVGLAGQGNRPMGVFLTTSGDRGRTFGPVRKVLGASNFGVRMAIDRSIGGAGRLHLAWLQAGSEPPFGGFGSGPNPIVSSYSDDGGVTFSPPVQVSSPGRPRVLAPALALGPDHAVHVGYYDLGNDVRDYQGLDGPVWEGTWSVVVRTSRDAGERFGPEIVVDDGVVPSERIMLVFTMPPPALVAAGANRLCTAWTDARHGDPDAVLRCSAGEGKPWETLRRLNDDPVGNGRSQYQPRLGVAPGGRIDAVFYDRRADSRNRLNDVVATYSEDSGRTFVPNWKLNGESSNTQLGPRYAVPSAAGQVEFGSRLGLLSTRSQALAAWTDTRNGATGKTSQDIFAGGLEFSGSSGPGSVGLGIAVSAAAAGLFAGVVLLLDVRAARTRRHTRGLRHDRPTMQAVVLVLALLLVAGCSNSVSRPPWPPSPAAVSVTMSEFRFDYPREIPAGRAVFKVRNTGSLEHELQFFALPEDLPPIDAQLRGTERRAVPALAGVPHRAPGEPGTFAVDLAPGQRYAMICFLLDGGEQHTLKGMSSEFRAIGATRQGGS